MDKYHVYEMVGTGTNSQVFKGRRKKSIEYVAIKRMEKSKIDNAMEEIKVSSSHPIILNLQSSNGVVCSSIAFYSTSNHLLRVKVGCCPRT